MSFSWEIIFSGLGAISAAFAAAFWLWASLVVVPDNVDTFVSEMQRIGRLNAYGASAACVAALSGTGLFILQIVKG